MNGPTLFRLLMPYIGVKQEHMDRIARQIESVNVEDHIKQFKETVDMIQTFDERLRRIEAVVCDKVNS